MKVIHYKGITFEGDKVSGIFPGTADELLEFAKQKKLLITDISEQSRKLKSGKYKLKEFLKDLEVLSYLISSGMKLDKAVMAVVRNAKKKSSAAFWEVVLNEIRGGKQFSTSLKLASRKVGFNIDEFYINIISVGEEVGDIKNSLSQVIKHIQFKLNILKEIKSALSYPVFVLSVSILVIFLIISVIIPKSSSIFTPKDLEKMPAISKTVIKFGKFLNENPSMFVFGFFIVVIFGVYLVTSPSFRGIMKKFLLRVPFFRNLILTFDFANFFSSFGAMLKGGVDIVKAIHLSSRIVSHPGLKNALHDVEVDIKKGNNMSYVLEKYSFIPDDIVSLIAAGENSASLDAVSLNLSKKYFEEFKLLTSTLLSMLEPITIILLGAFVGFIVVAIMLSVVSLTNVAG